MLGEVHREGVQPAQSASDLQPMQRDEHVNPDPAHLRCLGGAAEHIGVSG